MVADADKSKICLPEVRCEEFLGFLFVNLDVDAAPMESWFPGARAELEEWVPNWAHLKPLEWAEIPEKCNWKVSVENYSECYHCALNHLTFSNGIVKPETYDIQNTGEKLLSTSSAESDEILENSSNTDLTISAIVVNAFDKVKQVFMDDADSGQDFSADTVLDTSFSLSGTVSTAGSGTLTKL